MIARRVDMPRNGLLEPVIPPELFATHNEERCAENAKPDGFVALSAEPGLGLRRPGLCKHLHRVLPDGSNAASDD